MAIICLLILGLVSVFGLVACGGSKPNENGSGDGNSGGNGNGNNPDYNVSVIGEYYAYIEGEYFEEIFIKLMEDNKFASGELLAGDQYLEGVYTVIGNKLTLEMMVDGEDTTMEVLIEDGVIPLGAGAYLCKIGTIPKGNEELKLITGKYYIYENGEYNENNFIEINNDWTYRIVGSSMKTIEGKLHYHYIFELMSFQLASNDEDEPNFLGADIENGIISVGNTRFCKKGFIPNEENYNDFTAIAGTYYAYNSGVIDYDTNIEIKENGVMVYKSLTNWKIGICVVDVNNKLTCVEKKFLHGSREYSLEIKNGVMLLDYNGKYTFCQEGKEPQINS